MSVDKRIYGELQAVRRSEIVQFISSSVLQTFLTDLTSGTVSGYALADFLNNKSEWVSKILYLPIDYEKFIPSGSPLTTGYLFMGNHQYTDYVVKEMGTVGQLFQIKYFSYTPVRTHGNFLDFEQYTSIQIYVPYFQTITLNPRIVYGHTVDGYLSLDFHTGRLTLYIYIDDTELIETRSTNIGIEISIGKSNVEDIRRNNILQSISLMGSVATIGLGVATDNPIAIGGGIGMATRNLTSALENNVRHNKGYQGGSGDRTELSVSKDIVVIKQTVKQARYPDVTLKGKPLERNYLLSTMTGYTEIGYINFNPNGEEIMDDEITEIENLLRTGVIL